MLGHGPGNQGQLPLAAGDLVDAPVPKVLNAQLLQGPVRRLLLPPSRRVKGVRPHQHRVPDGIVVYRRAGLGDIRRQTGQSSAVQGSQSVAAQGNFSPVSGQKAQNAAEQGALACPVGAQHCHQLPRLRPEGHVPQHLPPPVGEGQLPYVNGHGVHLPSQ